jgi:hypothetical protein
MASRDASKAAGKTAASQRKAVPGAILLLRGSAMPPSPFDLTAPGLRIHVQYDPRNMAGMSAAGYGEFSSGEPEELKTLVCQFQHEGQSYGLMAVVLLVGSELRTLPKVKREGMTKAAADAAREMTKGRPEPIHWWLATRFALNGYVPRSEYVKATLALNSSFNTLPNVDQRNDVLIWRPSIARRCDELVEHIGKERKRNPYLDRVGIRQVMKWLALDRPILASIVMRQVAERFDSAVLDTFKGSALRLPPNLELPPAKRDAREEVLRIFESGEGMPLEKLIERWPKHRIVIKQLIEIGHLIESEEGFVFTERQVNEWLTKLKLRADAPIPGVGDLKKVLGLPRKDAEQLRALLLAKAEMQQP